MPCVLPVNWKSLELGPPVVALGERLAGQVQEPRIAGPVVEPVEADGEISAPAAGPAIKRRLGDHLIDLAAHFKSAGMMRGSPVASWYWVNALNRGKSGQTSYGLCPAVSPTGPSQPSGC